jgi:hypothetical protein
MIKTGSNPCNKKQGILLFSHYSGGGKTGSIHFVPKPLVLSRLRQYQGIKAQLLPMSDTFHPMIFSKLKYRFSLSMCVDSLHHPPSLCLCGWVGSWFDPVGPLTRRAWHQCKSLTYRVVFPCCGKRQIAWCSDQWEKFSWFFWYGSLLMKTDTLT